MIYATPTLQRRAVHRHVLYHRMRTLSFLQKPITSSCFANERQRQQVLRHNFGAALRRHNLVRCTSWAVAAGLFVAEFAAIIAGAPVFSSVTAGATAFDPKLGLTDISPRKIDVRTGCDDFFVPTRGIHRASAVLKCISSFQEDIMASSVQDQELDSITLHTNLNDNVHTFAIESTASGKRTSAQLSIVIRTIGQGELQVAPFRWDINDQELIAVFRKVVEGTLNRSIPSFEERSGIFSVTSGAMTYVYEEETFEEPHDLLARSLASQLRRMDVVLNSTAAPWIFVDGRTFQKRPDIVVAIVVFNRVSHGAVAIIALVLVVLRVVVNIFLTSFDDVMYVIMKDTIRDDCAMGPLTENRRTTPEAVPLHVHSTTQKNGDDNTNWEDDHL
ncbi:hypothetical protein FGB62_120g121 [Gracilaria domingensis]|nr:hypothetical protein FGB62_120g121 [Gracilaria domingensis]